MCCVSCGVISPWSAKSLLLPHIFLGGEYVQITILDNWLSISLLFRENTWLFLLSKLSFLFSLPLTDCTELSA